jgi:hypothetical protein
VFRILHSMIQCTSNIVRFRFPLFALASLCLLGLTVHAGARILHDCLGWLTPPPASLVPRPAKLRGRSSG